MDKQAIKRELQELSHFIWGISIHMEDWDYDDEIHPKFIQAMGRLGDLIIDHHRWRGGGKHPLEDIKELNCKRDFSRYK